MSGIMSTFNLGHRSQVSALQVEEREAAQIAARRERAAERRERFLDARTRSYGVSTKASPFPLLGSSSC